MRPWPLGSRTPLADAAAAERHRLPGARSERAAPAAAPQSLFKHAAGSAFLVASPAAPPPPAVAPPQGAKDPPQAVSSTLLLRGLPQEVSWVFEAAAQAGLRQEMVEEVVARYREVAAAGAAPTSSKPWRGAASTRGK